MACYHPLAIPHPKFGIPMRVPCGQCIGCRIEKSRKWAIRCVHEAQLHDEKCFITLTYDDEHLPPNRSLRKEDMTLFLKRLRKAIEPQKVRFIQCGEYGDQTDRPHHHMILYGYDFHEDRKYLCKSGDNTLYHSPMLDKLWGHGACQIGDVTFESAAYVAKYTIKRKTGPQAVEEYDEKGRIAPYITMSRRPGIGADWYDEFKGDVYPYDEVVVRDKVTCKPPPYYDKLLRKEDELLYLKIKRERVEAALANPDYDNPARQVVKEKVLTEKVKNSRKKI